jgi:hypothetical protein
MVVVVERLVDFSHQVSVDIAQTMVFDRQTSKRIDAACQGAAECHCVVGVFLGDACLCQTEVELASKKARDEIVVQ